MSNEAERFDSETSASLTPSESPKQRKRSSEIEKLSFRLMIIVAAVAFILALVNVVTSSRIKKNMNARTHEAMSSLFVTAEMFDRVDIPDSYGISPNVKAVYEAKSGEYDSTIGYCVVIEVNGFGGKIKMLVGVSTSVNVTGVKILSHGETAGYSQKALSEGGVLISSLINASQSSVTGVETVSGATVTSKSVIAGTAAALDAVRAVIDAADAEGGL